MQLERAVLQADGTTATAHSQAVERVIVSMRQRLSEPLSLPQMAKIAYLSPFHFDRVFHQITGLPPVQFLYALRIEEAKRLLLTTSLSVTDVCYETGYNSLGTFTSRFTQLVGLSPRQFRRLAQKVDNFFLEALFSENAAVQKTVSPGPSVTGRIITPTSVDRLIFIGLFPISIPQGRPVAGTLLTSAGPYCVAPVPRGEYHVFVAAFRSVPDPLGLLLPDGASLLVGVGKERVNMLDEKSVNTVNVRLRPLRIIDPPILISLPLLLNENLTSDEARV